MLTVPFYGIWSLFLLMAGTGALEGGDSLKVDFLAYWAGSSLALSGEAAAAYDSGRMYAEQLSLHGDPSGSFAWLYPPTWFFFVLPLALLPVAASLAGWFAATGALLLTAIRRISSDRAAVLLALAFPAVFLNFVAGQNGLLMAGLFAWGVVLLRDRPVPAGVAFGLMSFKPQFFPLILVALLAWRQKRALMAATGSAAALALASLVFFGFASWEGFLSAATGRADLITDGGAELGRMQSVLGALLLAGVPTAVAQAAQAAVALACVGWVAALWRRDVAPEYKAAGLAIAILLASPYSYHYDLTLLGLAVLWLSVGFQQEGWQDWDAEGLLLAWFLPLLSMVTGASLGVAFSPIVFLLLLGLLLRRTGDGRGRVPDSRRAGDVVAAT